MASVYTRGGHSFNVEETRQVVLDTMEEVERTVFIELKRVIGNTGYGYTGRHYLLSIKVDDIVAVES